jgi:hypothetical protein
MSATRAGPSFASSGTRSWKTTRRCSPPVRVAELHLEPARYRYHRILVQHLDDFDAITRTDLHTQVLCDQRGETFELLREDRGRVVGRLGEVARAVGPVGDRSEEILAESVAKTHRRRRRAVLGSRGDRREIALARDADVRLPVGQQDHPAHAVARPVELFETLEPTTREIGLAPSLDRRDAGEGLGAGLRERLHERHHVVIGDHRELVGRLEPLREERGARLRGRELGSLHRARAVDHQRDSQRRAHRAIGERNVELEHAVDGMLSLEGKELMVKLDLGVHGGLPISGFRYWCSAKAAGRAPPHIAALRCRPPSIDREPNACRLPR